MNGKKAKLFRKISAALAHKHGLPFIKYETRIIRKVYKVPHLGKTVVLEVPVVSLGECARGLYQHIKKQYVKHILVSS